MKLILQRLTDFFKNNKPYYLIYAAMFILLLCLDRQFKTLVTDNLALGEAWPSADNFARILYTQNTGVSFGLFAGHPEILIVLQTILFAAVIVAIVITYKKLRHPLLQTALCWIACGGLGNLIDRFIHSYVIDYIAVGTFPIWNFADMCIVGGCILLGIFFIFIYESGGEKKDRTQNDE